MFFWDRRDTLAILEKNKGKGWGEGLKPTSGLYTNLEYNETINKSQKLILGRKYAQIFNFLRFLHFD